MSARILAIVLGSLLASLAGCGADEPAAAKRRGVLLVVLDTLRADHLSCYGYERETSPNLDRLAAEGELYLEAYSQAPWTLPSIASIHTGLLPYVHGAGTDAQKSGLFPLRPGAQTIAERLAPLGYRNAAFVNVVFCAPKSGLARGFETYDFRGADASNRGSRSAGETTDAALSWARGLAPDEPFFLWVHYFDAHLTYDPPPPYDTLFEPDGQSAIEPGFGSDDQVVQLRRGEIELTPRQRESLVARYDGEIRYVDAQFARLRAGLEELGLWDELLVVVVGDHGEEFWDHGGFEHGHTHHRELLRVPLIVRAPGRAPAVKRERVRQIDVLPTILDHVGVAPGASPELAGGVLGVAGSAFSVAMGSLWSGDLLSIRSSRGTMILDRGTGERRFYAADDTGEERPLPAAEEDAARRLGDILDALPRFGEGGAEAWKMTPGELEELRKLGYVE